MKEKQIIKKFKKIEFLAQIIDGKISMITDDKEDDENFFSDNDEWLFAFYQLLKEVDKQGGFDHLKTINNEADEENIEKIYI